jgi:hypothetical protein
MPAKPKPRTLAPKPAAPAAPLLADVRDLILTAREAVARTVNAGLTLLYWEIGTRIRRDILQEKRAEYGEQILSALSAKLEAEFGRGFGERNLARMVKFAEAFPDPNILTALRTKLGWTHFRRIIYLDDPLQRDFYAEMCRMENWSTRTLEQKIGSAAGRAWTLGAPVFNRLWHIIPEVRAMHSFISSRGCGVVRPEPIKYRRSQHGPSPLATLWSSAAPKLLGRSGLRHDPAPQTASGHGFHRRLIRADPLHRHHALRLQRSAPRIGEALANRRNGGGLLRGNGGCRGRVQYPQNPLPLASCQKVSPQAPERRRPSFAWLNDWQNHDRSLSPMNLRFLTLAFFSPPPHSPSLQMRQSCLPFLQSFGLPRELLVATTSQHNV